MQALRPGPECRFRVPVQSTDSGPAGCPKKEALCRAHHFESIISRGQAKQSACCMSPLVSFSLQNIVLQGSGSAALVGKQWQQWAESVLFPVHKGIFPDGHMGKQQEIRWGADMLSSGTAYFLLPMSRAVRAVRAAASPCRTGQSPPGPGLAPGCFLFSSGDWQERVCLRKNFFAV